MGEKPTEPALNMPDDLREMYDNLWNEVAGIHSQWKIFYQLFTNEERVDFLREMAPSFFGVLQNAFLDNIVVMLCRITDPEETGKKKNLTLERLVHSIDASIY